MIAVLSSAPIFLKPLPNAYAEAPRKLLLYTFRALVKFSVSRIFSAVATVGAPSLNSSVPIEVWTRSGVTSDGGMAVDDCAPAGLLGHTARTAAASVPVKMASRTGRPFMRASPTCLLEQHVFDQRRDDRDHLEADEPALPVVFRLDQSVVHLERELDGQFAELEQLAHAEADGEGQLVAVVGLPVDQDVGGHAHLPGVREQIEDEVLEVHRAGVGALAVTGERPPLVEEPADDPFLAHVET